MNIGERDGKEFGRSVMTNHDGKGHINPNSFDAKLNPSKDSTAKTLRNKHMIPFSLAGLPQFVPYLLDLEHANCIFLLK